MYDFWLMIYQNAQHYLFKFNKKSIDERKGLEKSFYPKILMLTNFIENNRQKCSIYFPIECDEYLIIRQKSNENPMKNNGKTRLEQYFKEYLIEFEARNQKNEIESIEKKDTFLIKVDRIECVDDALEKEFTEMNDSCFVIKNICILKKYGYSIRKLLLLYCVRSKRDEFGASELIVNSFYCYHYWYPDWPDHRSPRDINTLLDIALHFLNSGKCEEEFDISHIELGQEMDSRSWWDPGASELYQQDIFNAVQPLPVVHCSAGIGRTGCMMAILNGIRQIRQSLAHSLISMAKQLTTGATNQNTVDYRLPKMFLEKFEPQHIKNNAGESDFSFNTLLYVYYILSVERRRKSNEESTFKRFKEKTSGEDLLDRESPQLFQHLPSLAELSKMPNIFVDILGIVCNLRLQRGGMVQNSEQYELIHRALCLYLKRTFALKYF